MTNAARPSPIAWLIAPAGLLFVLFFVMPFAVMTAMSFYSGNPVTNPNAFLKPLPLMYNEFGTVVALVHIYVPFMVLTLTGVIGRIDERLEQAARSLGAGRVRAFVEVTLPLSLPGILAGSLLVFALSISAYVTPSLMGGTDVLTLPMLIAQQVGTSFNPNLAAALGMILLLVSLAIVVAYNRILARLSGEQGMA